MDAKTAGEKGVVCAYAAVPAPFVLLHGFGQRGASWDDIAARLCAAGHAVYAPDLVRRGERGEVACLGTTLRGVDGAFPLACTALASYVCEVAEREGAAPLLVGYSMGGRLVAELVSTTLPEDLPLAGIVLESAGLGPADEAERAALTARNAAWCADVRAQGVERFMRAWAELPLFATQKALPDTVRERVRAERESASIDELVLELDGWGQHRQGWSAHATLCLDLWTRTGVPVRYVAGALDGKYVKTAHLVERVVPGVEVVIVPDAGHNVHLEQPAAFADALLQVAAQSVPPTTR